MSDRGERRRRTAVKVRQREKMMEAHGQQKGTLYEKHCGKVDRSLGYMRDGNVSHYVAVGFRYKKKTKSRRRYGAVKVLCRRDRVQAEGQEQQLRDLAHGDERDELDRVQILYEDYEELEEE